MGRDPNTPEWVQHLAFKVKDRDTLIKFKDKLEKNGIDVLGITDHSIFHSIYFFLSIFKSLMGFFVINR